ncbi:MAG: tryptophan 7-halogenase [Alteromonadales bacterium]|nr:tryptophan 7-halogenase [Alteromonadales bacterium]
MESLLSVGSLLAIKALIQTVAIHLLKLFPHNGINTEEVDEFNRQSKLKPEVIRDFIILHYK